MSERGNASHNLANLERIAGRLRLRVLEMVARTGQGYVQQGLGAADIFAALYFAEAQQDPANPDWPDRDRVFLTTAHNTAVFYATLAERGYFDPELLEAYVQDGSPLEINACERLGRMVEATCGSLGQGLSVAVGTALALRRQDRPARCYVVMGDGEMQEGQVWEALLSAGAWGLDNLCVILDFNEMQCEGPMHEVISLRPVVDKLQAFGFAVRDVDGNDVAALLDAFDAARTTHGKPTFVVATTMVGKGVPELEGLMAHQLKFPPELAERAIAAMKGQTA